MISVYEFNKHFLKQIKLNLDSNEIKNKFPFYNDFFYKKKIEKNEIFSKTDSLLLDFSLAYLRNKKILEIGCGLGQLSIFLNLNGLDIEACEINEPRNIIANKIKTYFKSNTIIYREVFQNLDLRKYDVILGSNLESDHCDFKKDKIIFDELLKQKKFIIIDGALYGCKKDEQNNFEKQEYFNNLINLAKEHFYLIK